MQNKAMIVWIGLWAITMPIINARNAIAAKSFELGSVIFTGAIFLIPAIIVALITWFVLKFVAKSLFNKPEVTPAMALLTWLVIFAFLFFIPLFNK